MGRTKSDMEYIIYNGNESIVKIIINDDLKSIIFGCDFDNGGQSLTVGLFPDHLQNHLEINSTMVVNH